ncbi:MAG: hypothetical protein FJZ75_09145 [Bacteroidetes bacterium]|nr:hypothetical protein [Bacteroidota bacterium]
MASTNDIIRQLEHEIELRRAEISTFQSIISQLSGKATSVSKVSNSTETVEPVKRAGRGRPRKNALTVAATETKAKVASAPKVASSSKPASTTKGAAKVGRPKVRKRAKGTVVDSVIRFLKRRKQFCESETILRGIKSKHKDKSAEDLFSYLSVTLSNLKNRGELISVKQDENGVKLNRNYWGLNRWVTKEGSIKPAFYFNQPAVEEAVIAD